VLQSVCEGVTLISESTITQSHTTMTRITKTIAQLPANTMLHRMATQHIKLGVAYTYTEVDRKTGKQTQVTVIA
jgi:hypothetical protein